METTWVCSGCHQKRGVGTPDPPSLACFYCGGYNWEKEGDIVGEIVNHKPTHGAPLVNAIVTPTFPTSFKNITSNIQYSTSEVIIPADQTIQKPPSRPHSPIGRVGGTSNVHYITSEIIPAADYQTIQKPPSRPHSPVGRYGGTGELYHNCHEVQWIADGVKQQFINQVGPVQNFDVVEYRKQIVNGTNYFFKVRTSPHQYAFLRVHQDLKGSAIQLVGYQLGKTENDVIQYFEAEAMKSISEEQEVQRAVDSVRNDFENKIGRVAMFHTVEFCKQIVNGTLYFVKVQTADYEYVFLRIHRSLSGEYQLMAFQLGKTAHDHVDYFEVGDNPPSPQKPHTNNANEINTVHLLVDAVRPLFEEQIGVQDAFMLMEYCREDLDSGNLFFAKVQVRNNEFIFLRIHHGFNGVVQLQGYQLNKSVLDQVEYFDPNTHPTAGAATAKAELDRHVQKLVDTVRTVFESRIGHKLHELTAIEYRTQVVNGTNYFIKVRHSPNEFAFLRVHEAINGHVDLVAYQLRKTVDDRVGYFESEPIYHTSPTLPAVVHHEHVPLPPSLSYTVVSGGSPRPSLPPHPLHPQNPGVLSAERVQRMVDSVRELYEHSAGHRVHSFNVVEYAKQDDDVFIVKVRISDAEFAILTIRALPTGNVELLKYEHQVHGEVVQYHEEEEQHQPGCALNGHHNIEELLPADNQVQALVELVREEYEKQVGHHIPLFKAEEYFRDQESGCYYVKVHVGGSYSFLCIHLTRSGVARLRGIQANKNADEHVIYFEPSNPNFVDIGKIHSATPEVQRIADSVRGAFESHVGPQPKFEVLEYRCQVGAGTTYFMKVQVRPNECAFLRVTHSLGKIRLAGYQLNRSEYEQVEYFDEALEHIHETHHSTTVPAPSFDIGGGEILPASDIIQVIVQAVRHVFEANLGRNVSMFKAVEYCTQNVAGTKYFIKVQLGASDYAFLRVHHLHTGATQLLGYELGKTIHDRIHPFESGSITIDPRPPMTNTTTGSVLPSSEAVQLIVDAVRNSFEDRVGYSTSTFKAVEYCTQMGVGVNYFVKVHLGGSRYTFLRIHYNLSGAAQLVGYLLDRNINEHIHYFDATFNEASAPVHHHHQHRETSPSTFLSQLRPGSSSGSAVIGSGGVFQANGAIQRIIEEVRRDVELHLGKFHRYEAVEYRAQPGQGTVYIVKVQVDSSSYIFLRIQSVSGKMTLLGYRTGKTALDPLEHFDELPPSLPSSPLLPTSYKIDQGEERTHHPQPVNEGVKIIAESVRETFEGYIGQPCPMFNPVEYFADMDTTFGSNSVALNYFIKVQLATSEYVFLCVRYHNGTSNLLSFQGEKTEHDPLVYFDPLGKEQHSFDFIDTNVSPPEAILRRSPSPTIPSSNLSSIASNILPSNPFVKQLGNIIRPFYETKIGHRVSMFECMDYCKRVVSGITSYFLKIRTGAVSYSFVHVLHTLNGTAHLAGIELDKTDRDSIYYFEDTNTSVIIERDAPVLGAVGDVHPSDSETQRLVDLLRPEFEARIGREVPSFDALEYRKQEVDGVNYYIKAQIGPQEYAFLHVHKSIDGLVHLDGLEIKGVDEPSPQPQHRESPTVGGVSELYHPNEFIDQLLDAVRPSFESVLGHSVQLFKPIEYCKQLVAGTNYFIKVQISESEYVFLRVHHDLSGAAKLVCFLTGKKADEHVHYFEAKEQSNSSPTHKTGPLFQANEHVQQVVDSTREEFESRVGHIAHNFKLIEYCKQIEQAGTTYFAKVQVNSSEFALLRIHHDRAGKSQLQAVQLNLTAHDHAEYIDDSISTYQIVAGSSR